MLHIILHQSLSYPKIGRPLISHYFDKRDLQRIFRTKQHISQVTLPALQRISQAKQRISQVTLPALMDYVAKLPSNSKSPIKFFTATGNLKSCFGVGNVNFRCMKVWRSYHVAKLLWRSYWQPLLVRRRFQNCP